MNFTHIRVDDKNPKTIHGIGDDFSLCLGEAVAYSIIEDLNVKLIYGKDITYISPDKIYSVLLDSNKKIAKMTKLLTKRK